jgi:hypothetical protein
MATAGTEAHIQMLRFVGYTFESLSETTSFQKPQQR